MIYLIKIYQNNIYATSMCSIVTFGGGVLEIAAISWLSPKTWQTSNVYPEVSGKRKYTTTISECFSN